MAQDDWRKKANCLGQPTEWWFPEVGERISPQAAEICDSCKVQQQCLHASLYPLEHGIWGGKGERQRRRYREKLRKPKDELKYVRWNQK